MESLLIPKPQPNFPHEDVSENNAAIFSQLMFERSYVESAHELAEQNVIAFKIGHQTLRSLGHALYMDTLQQTAFSYGATMYEALSVVVRPQELAMRQPLLIRQKVTDTLALQSDGFNAAFALRDEEERMLDEAPETTRLMVTASDLQPRMDRRIILMGAAIERAIDRDTLEAVA